MAWTDDLNRGVIRCYHMATELGANPTGYRVRLHSLFVERFPHLAHISEQRVADQYRVIHRNNRVPNAIREQIRLEVEQELQGDRQDSVVVDSPLNSTSTPPRGARASVRVSTTQANRSPLVVPPVVPDDVLDAFNLAHLEYSGMDPLCRPGIPKLRSNEKTNDILSRIDAVILSQSSDDMTLQDLHTLVYAGAVAAVRLHGQKVGDHGAAPRERRDPPWKVRLERRREALRQDIARVTQVVAGGTGRKLRRRVEEALRKHGLPDATPLTESLDTLKQKLAVVSNRIRRYTESYDRRVQNAQFGRNQKRFYRELRSKNTSSGPNDHPDVGSAGSYWSGIWSNPVQHNANAVWVASETAKYANTSSMVFADVTTEEVKGAIQRTQNWKAPGRDKVHNFWFKRFPSVHARLASLIGESVRRPEEFPPFLTAGVTYLIPKKDGSRNPADYRPITCLPTLYKFITSVISARIYEHLEANCILSEEQKGCRKRSMGCKEQLTIDAVVVGQAGKQKRNLFTCYIDYAKAFDSVPHSWLINVLQIYRLDPALINFLTSVMGGWVTAISVPLERGAQLSEPIPIRKGIFQGDSLSPIWFCMAMNPLSRLLNESGYGYTIKSGLFGGYRLSHLMYLDDIKLYAGTDHHLRGLLELTRSFSQDIRMGFGLDKCRIQATHKGVQEQHPGHSFDDIHIEAMDDGDLYRYLGVLQGGAIRNTALREGFLSKFNGRLKDVLKTQLSGGNKIRAVNTYVVPSLQYAFGIVRFSDTDLDALNRAVRTTMTRFRMHHPKSAVERMTLPRHIGGRGVVDIANQHHRQVQHLRTYFFERARTSPLHKAVCSADAALSPLNLKDRNWNPLDRETTDGEKLDSWKQKALHGKHVNGLLQPGVDLHASNLWLTKGGLFPETEGFMCAIQDNVIATRNYRKHILKERVENDRCRICDQAPETIDHLTTSCSVMAPREYTDRHNAVCKIVHQNLAYKHGLVPKVKPVYQYSPENVLENERFRLYWDKQILTDRTVPNNRPDVLLVDRVEKKAYIVDVAVCHSSNIRRKYAEKVEKYVPLAQEIREIWRLTEVHIYPIILSATGVIPTSLRDSLDKLGLKPHLMAVMQKYAILHTCAMVRKTLNISPN